MMKASFRKNLSASTLQLLTNHVFGLIIFYFLSKGLSKEEFGQLNWTLSLFLIIFSVLGCGIDQLIIRKIARGENKSLLLSLHLLHVFCTGTLTLCILLIPAIFNNNTDIQNIILIIGAGKLLLFFSTPFKTLSAGTENFSALFLMSISSVTLKGIGITLLLFTKNLTILNTALLFFLADGTEFFAGFMLVKKQQHLAIKNYFPFKEYINLLREAVPQIGVTIFSSALARIDWLLIGLFLSAGKVAEYSFAYKAFEMATLPLLAIAPLLIPLFSKIFAGENNLHDEESVSFIFRAEMIIAVLSALCLNILWNPAVDQLTNGKYGTVNTWPAFYLSLTIPFLYLNNFLWTIHFSCGRTHLIFISFVICFSVNLIANLLLIPLLQTTGAALSYLLAIAAQTVYYAKSLGYRKFDWRPFLICTSCGLVVGLITQLLPLDKWQLAAFSLPAYLALLVCFLQIRKSDLLLLRTGRFQRQPVL